MVEPNIVFCPFNHIYDAALHSECPYCKQIQEEQRALSKSLNMDEGADIVHEQEDYSEDERTEYITCDTDSDNDATELLRENAEEDEDSTELLRRESYINSENLEADSTELINSFGREPISDIIVNPDDEDEATELVYKLPEVDSNPVSDKTTHEDSPVLGWLVCNSGKQIGRSFEIIAGKNYLCIDNEMLCVKYGEARNDKVSAEIMADDSLGEFSINNQDNYNVYINNQLVKNGIIRNYDTIIIDAMEFVFVELMTEFVKWGI